MILESIMSMFTKFVIALIDTASFMSIPYDMVNTLQTFCSFGAYVVGSDLMFMFCTMVTSWLSVKLSLGLAIQLWKLLPLT